MTAERGIDRYRSIVFPNAVRELRRQRGFPRLLALSALIPDIPYVRLSKIERGEVVARADELRRIAIALEVMPEHLLVDVEAPDFDIAEWAVDLQDWSARDLEEDWFAVSLAAALRHRREGDAALSIAAIERNFGIAPVILSRLENAYKTFDRWNAQTMRAVCALMDVPNVQALRDHVARLREIGALDAHIELIASPAVRIGKTRAKVAALREELAGQARTVPPRGSKAPPRRMPPMAAPAEAADAMTPVIEAIQASDVATVRLVPVFGAPLLDGLIDRVATGQVVEAPRSAGPNAYGLRVCRPTLGPGLPAHGTVVIDPGRFPSPGGIAVVREAEGLRLLIVTVDRQGRMIGYSTHPDREVALDMIDPADVATVIAVALD
jgi:transcriptional regulator with XRE-family HTH domain